MANIAFDFLTESFLFDKRYIDNNYESVSEDLLQKELMKYREHIQNEFSTVTEEITQYGDLSVSIESLGKLPDESLLKQLALYLDKVIIPDPVFEMAQEKSIMHVPMTKLMGVNSYTEINRRKLTDNIKYMKWCTPLVSTQFVKFFPITLINESPKELPILYSEDNFSNELPKDLYEFFYKKAKVSNINIHDGIMSYTEDKELKLGTTINVGFDDEHVRGGYIYQFVQSKLEDFNDETGYFKMMQYIPDEICQEDFNHWVHQSINRAAIAEYRTTFNEVILANKLNCMYLAKSQFTSELLSQSISEKNIKSDLVNLSMKLELPVINKISLNDLISIRHDNGQAFHNFRTELSTKLLEVRGINDKEELKMRMENIALELNELQVNDVKKEYRKIVRSLGIDATLLTGSLVTSFLTGGITLLGAAGAVAKGSADYLKYVNEVKENCGYFLWKLNSKV